MLSICDREFQKITGHKFYTSCASSGLHGLGSGCREAELFHHFHNGLHVRNQCHTKWNRIGIFLQKITMSKLILLRYDCLVPAEALVRKDGLVQNPQRRGGWLFCKNDPPAKFARKVEKKVTTPAFEPVFAISCRDLDTFPREVGSSETFWGEKLD